MSLEFENVSFSYAIGREVLSSVSFGLISGDTLLIVGHNGAGKSSLLKLLNGINRPTSGKIRIEGTAVEHRPTADLARLVSVTFQDPSDQIFASTVLREVEFGPRNLRRPDSRSLAKSALDLFLLQDVAGLHPYDLPFAQRKLLTLASAVAMDTPLLAFDEPSVSLATPERVALLRALKDLQKNHRTVLIVSHDLEVFLPVCSKILVLNRGRATFFGTPADLLSRERLLREAQVRLPLSLRLRSHAGLPLLPDSHS